MEEQRKGSLSRFVSRCTCASHVPPVSVEFVNCTHYHPALENQFLSALPLPAHRTAVSGRKRQSESFEQDPLIANEHHLYPGLT